METFLKVEDTGVNSVLASVLVVEDNPIAAKVMMLRFSQLGCRVELATDGKSACELAACHQYDLILMDIGLPDMNGFQVTRFIREGELLSGWRVPIIALTAHSHEAVSDRCIEAGVDMVMSKPLRKEEEERMLEKFIYSKNQYGRAVCL